MQAAADVNMNLGWTVQIYNIAEALPNLINPFFMLPLLVWLLGMTFEFVPPVIPTGK